MRALFGVTNNSPALVMSMLREYKKGHKDLKVQVQGFGEGVKKGADVILVLSVPQFIKHIKELNASKAVVYVFDSPVLCEYLSPIQILDVLEKKVSYRYVFKPIEQPTFEATLNTGLKSGPNVEVKRSSVKVIPTLLGNQLPSILNPIQTYLYTIREQDKRVDIQRKIFGWLVSGKSTEVLKGSLENVGIQTSSIRVKRLVDFLDSPQVSNTRKALKVATKRKNEGKAIPFKKIEERLKVEAFDVRYIMAALRKASRAKKVGKDTVQLFEERKHIAAAKLKAEERAAARLKAKSKVKAKGKKAKHRKEK